MEGPLEYLPSGWSSHAAPAQQAPPSPSSQPFPSTSHGHQRQDPQQQAHGHEQRPAQGHGHGLPQQQPPCSSSSGGRSSSSDSGPSAWDRQNSSHSWSSHAASSSPSSSSASSPSPSPYSFPSGSPVSFTSHLWGPPSSPSTPPPSRRDALPPCDQQRLQASLRNHLFRALSDQPAIDLLEAGPHSLQRLTRVFGLVFKQPGHDQEGFYSLHAGTMHASGVPCEIIMVFELQEDAERYACLLEAAMEPHHPRVFSISASAMVRFCREHGYQCRMEPAGSLTVPPDCSVSLTDWERVKNLRNGNFIVLDHEPSASSGVTTAAAAATMRPQVEAKGSFLTSDGFAQ